LHTARAASCKLRLAGDRSGRTTPPIIRQLYWLASFSCNAS
jgi:poly-gamma-glutamate capsule biosynthesis protein CapA/YwtB (metallophosphatase superfamily)